MQDTLTRAEEREIQRRTLFLERVREGCGKLNAAIEVGWTPNGLKTRMKDDEFLELVVIAEDRTIEDIEEAVVAQARSGKEWATKMVLYNRRSDKWRDVRHIQTDRPGQIDQTVVLSVKQAMADMLQGGIESVAALQPKPMAIEVASRDADDG